MTKGLITGFVLVMIADRVDGFLLGCRVSSGRDGRKVVSFTFIK